MGDGDWEPLEQGRFADGNGTAVKKPTENVNITEKTPEHHDAGRAFS
jgi:hypothetical protein